MSILEAAKKKLKGLAVSFAIMADVTFGDKKEEPKTTPKMDDTDPSKTEVIDPETLDAPKDPRVLAKALTVSK